MHQFPSNIRFCKPWRTYQKRVLSELDRHLDDGHLHIVAAPGSGKTVLGLEVARRLNRPTIVFTPTTAIRDQWIDRLVALFCPPNESPDWISTDVRNPRFFTVCTYQALHSAFVSLDASGSGESKQKAGSNPTQRRSNGRVFTLAALKKAGIATIVFDEAHHLRNEWWNCLADVKAGLDNPAIVALTATPPYDVSADQWQRYRELCGPIDAIISVPELVGTGDLCPHQDCVHISTPLNSEKSQIAAFRGQVSGFLDTLVEDQAFVDALEKHPCVLQPKEHEEQILSDPDFYLSVAFFLNLVRSRPPKGLLRVLRFPARKCPGRETDWLEMLLSGCLHWHRDEFGRSAIHLDQIARSLKRIGALERKTVSLRSTSAIAKMVRTSASKLRSIGNILSLEAESLADRLRMVILTDYIRAEDMPANAEDEQPLTRIGVVPIFEYIRRMDIGAARPGILTGKMVVIPQEAHAAFEDVVAELRIGTRKINYKPLAHDPRFSIVTLSGDDSQKLTQAITRLFAKGGLNVLVGTASLLGEGWDAPSVNSLVLASYVGSFMLSNQMRGRAIRSQPDDSEKTANIWHLLCVEPNEDQPGEDMDLLARRFRAFVGISFATGSIASGLDRLQLGRPPFSVEDIERTNETTVRRARDRRGLANLWRSILVQKRTGRLVEEVVFPAAALPRKVVGLRLLTAVLRQVLIWAVFLAAWLGMRTASTPESLLIETVLWIVLAACIIASAALLANLLKTLWLAFGHRSAKSSARRLGKLVVKALAQTDALDSRPSKLKVAARNDTLGAVRCSLRNGTTRERSLFLDAMREVLGPIEDPRYVMRDRSRLRRLLLGDYFIVPQALAKNKTSAEQYCKLWSRRIAPATLVYTRTDQGRKTLLECKARARARESSGRADRRVIWR